MGPTLAGGTESAEWREAVSTRLDAVIDAAREAAAAVWTMRDRFTAEEKRPNDWVTDADRAADQVIHRVKDKRFPEDGWLSEESLVDSASGAFTWVVDPIDGTREFVEGLPEYAVSIGLVWQGHAVAGAIAHPPSGVVMAGAVTTGLRQAATAALPGARGRHTGLRILVSRSDLSRDRFRGWTKELPLTAVGSIAYKLALVAYGEADAVVSVTGKNPWDVVGGFGLLRAAGIVPHFLDAREHTIPAVNERLLPFIVTRDPDIGSRLFAEAQAHAARYLASRGRRS
ncbi:MAG: inositol monophosphatase family protein [Nitrospirota bacterium]